MLLRFRSSSADPEGQHGMVVLFGLGFFCLIGVFCGVVWFFCHVAALTGIPE